jgi:hypothetical protein
MKVFIRDNSICNAFKAAEIACKDEQVFKKDFILPLKYST